MKFSFLVLCISASVLAAECQTTHDEICAWCAATHELLDASGPVGAYLAGALERGISYSRIKPTIAAQARRLRTIKIRRFYSASSALRSISRVDSIATMVECVDSLLNCAPIRMHTNRRQCHRGEDVRTDRRSKNAASVIQCAATVPNASRT